MNIFYLFRLLDLCSTDKSKQFDEKFVAKKAGLIDFIEMYSSLQISFDFLIQKCDMIMPRYYTVASSSLMKPKEVKIAISLSKFKAFGT